MTMRRSNYLAVLLAAATAAAPFAARAVDAPHDESVQSVTCKSCHTAHKAPGASLTTVGGNANLCASCHTDINSSLGFPWTSGDQAVPGSHGSHHRWDADAVNAAHGATAPTDPEMTKRLPGGKLQCSTCHDQHGNRRKTDGTLETGLGNVHISVATGTQLDPNASVLATGKLTVNAPGAGAEPRGFLIEVSGTGFYVSNDNGRTAFGFSGGTWVACAGTNQATLAANCGATPARPIVVGSPLTLNRGAAVDPAYTVTFNVSPQSGAKWKFYAAYPLLRASNDLDALCLQCHADRNQTAAMVEGNDASYPANGTNKFSHPVGESLARSYDQPFVAGGILDVDGGVQAGSASGTATADTNSTNDIVLVGGKVRCTSCHAPHNADSNSLSVDKR